MFITFILLLDITINKNIVKNCDLSFEMSSCMQYILIVCCFNVTRKLPCILRLKFKLTDIYNYLKNSLLT